MWTIREATVLTDRQDHVVWPQALTYTVGGKTYTRSVPASALAQTRA